MANRQWTEEEILELMEEKYPNLPMSEARIQAEFWVIDHNDWLPNENKEEVKAKIKSATKGISNAEKPKAERKPKEKDKEKVDFISSLVIAMQSENLAENIKIVNSQKEITFNIGENEYSLSLIRHRKPKN